MELTGTHLFAGRNVISVAFEGVACMKVVDMSKYLRRKGRMMATEEINNIEGIQCVAKSRSQSPLRRSNNRSQVASAMS